MVACRCSAFLLDRQGLTTQPEHHKCRFAHPSRPGRGGQRSRWRPIGCAAGLLPMLPPGDMCVCSRASHGFSHCGYLPAFSNGFTSRRTVFHALTWPPGWASNVPLRCISELRSLGDQLVWLVALPPARLATGRVPSVRTAGNADIRSGLGQQEMLPHLQSGGSCLQCELRMRASPLGLQGASKRLRWGCDLPWALCSCLDEYLASARRATNRGEVRTCMGLSGSSNAFQRLSCLGSTDSGKLHEDARGILENGKRTAHLMLMRSHCDVLITGRSPSDQLRHPICTEASDFGFRMHVLRLRFHAVSGFLPALFEQGPSNQAGLK